MSELKACPFCGSKSRQIWVSTFTEEKMTGCSNSDCEYFRNEYPVDWWQSRPIEDELRAELEKRTAELHYANTACMEMKHELDRLNAEIKTTDDLLKEATETIGAVIACCTYNSNDDAKIGIYGIDQKAFTRIDQFITHYNDAVSAGKVSVDVKTSTDNNKGE